jgi:nucleotide-binding universal stress UspA family protein
MFRSVVVGATDSKSAAAAFHKSMEVVEASGGTLHIVTAFKAHRPTPPDLPEELRYSFGPTDPPDVLLQELMQEAKQASIAVSTHPVLANPVEAIMKVAAQEHADLIVVGAHSTRGHRSVSHVPKALVDRSPCPVLVV